MYKLQNIGMSAVSCSYTPQAHASYGYIYTDVVGVVVYNVMRKIVPYITNNVL